ncbi:hypothetical protein NDU88_002991 [Pleurodeles waltl]|uniref:Uncharacterized protein n=1 Tax=Pleurodeles waltl TaxID=8319 RepID=A0AAV7LE00_PLEWA|nr:hypothetical protein NDU88_002991 [Pleurodeles waltl]
MVDRKMRKKPVTATQLEKRRHKRLTTNSRMLKSPETSDPKRRQGPWGPRLEVHSCVFFFYSRWSVGVKIRSKEELRSRTECCWTSRSGKQGRTWCAAVRPRAEHLPEPPRSIDGSLSPLGC